MDAGEKEPGTTAVSAVGRSTRGRVLVVDDDSDLRDCLQVILEENGFDVVVAADGVAAFLILRTLRIDVLLVDYAMPLLDGLAFLREYANTELGSSKPVVMMTGLRNKAFPGASSVLLKPFGLREVLDALLAAGLPPATALAR